MEPIDPRRQRREDALAKLDLGRVFAQILRFASSRAQSRDLGRDLAQQAFADALDPKGSPWDPDKQPELFLDLVGRVRGALARHRKKLRLRADPEVVATVVVRLYPDPSSAGIEGEQERSAHYQREWAALRDSFNEEGDALTRCVIAQYEAGTSQPADQAVALGVDPEDIYAENRRIRLRARALRKKDTNAAKPTPKEAQR